MSLLPLLLGTSEPKTAIISHLDNYKHALSNLKTSIERDGIILSIDVNDYEPSEVTVTTFDNSIIIEGKHDDKLNSLNCRHFVRTYTLPKTIDINDMTTFSSDGLFTIYVPPKLTSVESTKIESTKQLVLPIQEIKEYNKSGEHIDESLVRVIPIQLTEESTKPVAIKQLVPIKPRKILRFENLQDSKESINETTPEEGLNKRKLFCCC